MNKNNTEVYLDMSKAENININIKEKTKEDNIIVYIGGNKNKNILVLNKEQFQKLKEKVTNFKL